MVDFRHSVNTWTFEVDEIKPDTWIALAWGGSDEDRLVQADFIWVGGEQDGVTFKSMYSDSLREWGSIEAIENYRSHNFVHSVNKTETAWHIVANHTLEPEQTPHPERFCICGDVGLEEKWQIEWVAST